MRILFVCRFLPHQLARDSGRLDSYYYMKALSENHAVSVVAFAPLADEPDIADLSSFCERVTVVPYDQDGLLARFSRLGGRLLWPQVYGRNQSQSYRQAVRAMVAEQAYDVAVVHGMMARYGRDLAPIPCVLDEVDLFFMVAHQQYRQTERPFQRIWLGFDWLRTMLWEAHYLNKFDAVFVRSQKDEVIVRDLAPQQKVMVLPPWFEGLAELQNVQVKRPLGNKLLFVGAMNTPANIEAVTYFTRQVLPRLRTLVPDVQFQIVGANPTSAVRMLAQEPNVTVVGEVPNLTPYYEEAAVVVAPLFIGGGIIVKTLNGLASGRPVVTTRIGNSGTGAEDKQHLRIVSADPDDMTAAIVAILTDPGYWQQLAASGRQFIRTRYDWQQIAHNLDAFLHELVY
jgi:polysaccharide biosynthesis protein PslH